MAIALLPVFKIRKTLQGNFPYENIVAADNLQEIGATEITGKFKRRARDDDGVLHLVLSVHQAQFAPIAWRSKRQRAVLYIYKRWLDGSSLRSTVQNGWINCVDL